MNIRYPIYEGVYRILTFILVLFDNFFRSGNRFLCYLSFPAPAHERK